VGKTPDSAGDGGGFGALAHGGSAGRLFAANPFEFGEHADVHVNACDFGGVVHETVGTLVKWNEGGLILQ